MKPCLAAFRIALSVAILVCVPRCLRSAEARPSQVRASAARGYELLLTKPFLAKEFSPRTFANLWKVWPKPLKEKAAAATADQRRRMAFTRYGFIPSPDRNRKTALGFVVDDDGDRVMNCLVCHGGKVAGRVIPGLGNTHFAFQTLTQDLVRAQIAEGKQPSEDLLNRLYTPLGRSNGTTDAQLFSVALVSLRDGEMNFHAERKLPKLMPCDLDAPPLWNTKKKSRLYIDGFVGKSPRTIMQFVLIPRNDAETLKSWEDDFRDVLAWIESLEPPKYPWTINRDLAARGKTLFNQTCADCHGTYGPDGHYPEKTVPIEEIGTDDTRLRSLPLSHRRFFETSWFSDGGTLPVIPSPGGYVAPPLDGIWASAPYLHNGSVPTLWHLFHVDRRPAVWRRSEDGYDRRRVGLEVTEYDAMPPEVRHGDEKRMYFNTRLPSKSAAGHEFPETLSEDEKLAVIEYLKTL